MAIKRQSTSKAGTCSVSRYRVTVSLTHREGVRRYVTCCVPLYETRRDRENVLARLRPQAHGVAESPVLSTNIGGWANVTVRSPLSEDGEYSAGSPRHIEPRDDIMPVLTP